MNGIVNEKQINRPINCNENDKQILREKYLSKAINKKFDLNCDTRILRKSLQECTEKIHKRHVNEIELREETFSVKEATLSELKQMGFTKPSETFGENKYQFISLDHHYTILKFWADCVDKVVNDDMTRILNEDVQKTIVQFLIESIKSMENHPTVVHVNF